jgi:uncharacterized protein
MTDDSKRKEEVWKLGRRDFVKGATLAAAGSWLAAQIADSGQSANTSATEQTNPAIATDRVPKRKLGGTGLEISVLGLGGYHLGSAKDERTASEIVAQAMDAGVSFFDNAWEYHDGESETRVGNALKGRRNRAIVMTKVCTHGRGKAVAMRMLEESLTRLQTDYLDIWQIHEVIYDNDPDLIFAAGGVAEALQLAKQREGAVGRLHRS